MNSNENKQLELADFEDVKICAESTDMTISFEIPIDSYRVTKKDYIYYNSDLNKFIGDQLPRIMTSIDMDLLQFKKSKKLLRNGEYKHIGENVGYQQNEVLKEIARLYKWAMDHGYDRKLQCHLIKGNYPYAKLEIFDYITNTTYILEGDEVKKYLTIEL
jgi:hypothetical protein